MRTTLDIETSLLTQVEEMTGESSPSKAVTKALSEFIRRRKIDELRKLLGTMHLVDNWRELEELELREMREQGR